MPYLSASQRQKPAPEGLARPWAMQASEVLHGLGVKADEGLTEQEATNRLRRFGKNLLRTAKPRHVMAILADQFKSAVIILLGAAALLAAAFGDFVEGMAIGVVIAINTAIGFFTEWRAIRSMEALRRLGRVETVVRRGGRTRKVHSDSLVPGDIVLIEDGDIIPADLRLINASKLQADESTLTGESMPVSKQTESLPAETDLMQRNNLLFKGTAINRGSGLGVVVATGADSELGQISRLVAEAEAQVTPLEKRLNDLGRRLVWVVLIISAMIATAGILTGREIFLAIEIAIALAVAAIPEGLPIVATIALARGMRWMARRNALITRLSAVETLGATGVILTDKTGTLTENRMTVSTIELFGHTVTVGGTGLETCGEFVVAGEQRGEKVLRLVDDLLRTVALCSNASLDRASANKAKVIGDPTETALLIAAAKRGIQSDALQQAMPELREEPFEPETKLMATFNSTNGSVEPQATRRPWLGKQTKFAGPEGSCAPFDAVECSRLPPKAGAGKRDAVLVSVKGAPESILPNCVAVRTPQGDIPMDDEARHAILQRAHAMGLKGLRTLGVATRTARDVQADPYEELIYLGTVGLLDPPRQGVKQAIRRFREAGVRVIMVTGDHVATAGNIAIGLGLADPDNARETVRDARSLLGHGGGMSESQFNQIRVIARATPKQKLGLIDRYQKQGNVVAMTGDGVNDAPALKKADIGIAMGIRGTAVAKEAAAMVLLDDDFSTIVEAIAQGRTIYENIRKFVIYLFSCNISEILIVSLTTLASAPLPLLPLQILFLNLVTDVFPALALGVGQVSAAVMRNKPRPANEPMLTRRHWQLIGAYGILLSASVLGAMAFAIYVLGFNHEQAVSVSFCTLALGQLWHVFNMRSRRRNWIRNEITGNGWVWVAIGLCLLLVLGAIYIPEVSTLLKLAPPGRAGWVLIIGMSLVPLLLGPFARIASGYFGTPPTARSSS